MAISTEDVIHCWWAEGFLGEHSTYDEVYDRGTTMIESLKDACLLETQKLDSVKMHDVVRDVAIWIAKSLGDEHSSLIRAGIGLAEISHIKISASVKRISFVSNKIERLPIMECPETTTLLLQDNPLRSIPRELLLTLPALKVLNLSGTRIRSLPSSINSLHQLHALILQNCELLDKLPPIGNLGNLQLLDCADTRLRRLPQGMDKLTDLRLLNLPAINLESISQGILVKLSSIEMINLLDREKDLQMPWLYFLGSTCFDELSSLHKLTSLYIRLDSSSFFSNRDNRWMARLKRFHIEVGEAQVKENYNKSRRTISVSKCEIFSKGELSGMLQFASDLKLVNCMGLRELIAYNRFDGLKALYIKDCYCNFRQTRSGLFDPLPNLEYLSLEWVVSLKRISDLGHLLGLRFSKLRQLEVYRCHNLTCLFNVGGVFSVPKHLEEITIDDCDMLVRLFGQWSGSSQTKPLVTSEIPKVRKLSLRSLQNFETLGETSWEHLEELTLKNVRYYIVKLPLSIQTSKNIKVIRGSSEWWNQLRWDDDNFKSNLEHCFLPH